MIDQELTLQRCLPRRKVAEIPRLNKVIGVCEGNAHNGSCFNPCDGSACVCAVPDLMLTGWDRHSRILSLKQMFV